VPDIGVAAGFALVLLLLALLPDDEHAPRQRRARLLRLGLLASS